MMFDMYQVKAPDGSVVVLRMETEMDARLAASPIDQVRMFGVVEAVRFSGTWLVPRLGGALLEDYEAGNDLRLVLASDDYAEMLEGMPRLEDMAAMVDPDEAIGLLRRSLSDAADPLAQEIREAFIRWGVLP